MDEIVAVGIGVYEAVKAKAFYAQQKLLANMVQDFKVWLLEPMQTRMTFPFCVRWIVADMFQHEKDTGVRADWFLWMDDDVIPPPDALNTLRAAADPMTRPHVAALAYSRNWPYHPSAELLDSTGEKSTWIDHPTTGTHPVHHVGMSMALIHRSIFDIVPEPWFDIESPRHGCNGFGPDRFFSRRIAEYGIKPHVCFDVECGHITDGVIMNTKLARELRMAP